MRVVNLSQRPFLNRRPVLRLAVVLWVVGGLMLATNAWLFAGYLSGTTKNRERLAELNTEIDAAESEFDQLGERLSQVSLGDRNQHAVFLNELIDQRTFPWSRLFDDLEDALSDDVYLTLVSPSVEKEKQKAGPRTTSRRITPREARKRALERRSGGGGGSGTRGPASMPTPETTNVAESSDFDVVTLKIVGVARSDEALLSFVDGLYQNERFVKPDLFTERRGEGQQRGFLFDITTYYLLARRHPAQAATDEAIDVAQGEMGTAEGAESAAVVDGGSGDEPEKPGKGKKRGAAGADDAKAGEGGTAGRQPQRDLRAGGDGTNPAGAEGEKARTAAADDRKAPKDEKKARDPRVRRPGTSNDRRPLDEIRSRLDALDEADGRGSSSQDDAPEPSRDESRAEPDEPSLTQPAASATPALRRLGSLSPSSPPTSSQPTSSQPAPSQPAESVTLADAEETRT